MQWKILWDDMIAITDKLLGTDLRNEGEENLPLDNIYI